MIARPLSIVDEPAVGAIYTLWRTRTHSEPRDEERAEQHAVNGVRLRSVEARLTDPVVGSTRLPGFNSLSASVWFCNSLAEVTLTSVSHGL